jgi:hypothetical protein
VKEERMRFPIVCLGVICLLVPCDPCRGEAVVHRFDVTSKAVGARYTIEVVVPSGAPATGSKLPTVYCTDWFILSDFLKALPGLMDMGHLTEPFVLVGISQPGGPDAWATARTRDFTPARPTDDYSKRNVSASAVELAGGAGRFVSFLRDELIPRVESTCPADPSRRGFLGYSFGGLLGVQILAREPRLFHYYLLGSPSVWFNDYALALELQRAPAGSLESVRRVYVSVGEEESWEMLKGFGLVRGALSAKGLESPRLKTEIIPEAGHVGGMPISLYNGLRFLFRGK